MVTGTSNKDEIPKIVKDFLSSGHTEITIKKDAFNQWIVAGK